MSGVKNVHAYVKGIIGTKTQLEDAIFKASTGHWKQLIYDKSRGEFISRDGNVMYQSTSTLFLKNGIAYVV